MTSEARYHKEQLLRCVNHWKSKGDDVNLIMMPVARMVSKGQET